MKLSIVIVNYNVKFFLEQCLRSVHKAIQGIDAEVFVVDNASVDGSQEMLRKHFPWIIQIDSKENLGFSRGNNLALRKAKGEYILLLNPDTVVEESTFRKCIEFSEMHPDLGALGVKMIDGRGKFLPESKRGLPTPWVSFYKMSGLSKLFPKSKKFARYHLGHLSADQTHEIDVLAGAYMWMSKKALDKSGLLDEDFFMYGEDIDLSYRIQLAGFKNYYLSETSIIHYKGESTKKGSLNYVYVFYNAMAIFARKHFNGNYAKLFNFTINIAIFLRASLSIFKRLLRTIILPLSESILLFICLWLIKDYWEHNHRFIQGGTYPPELVTLAFPLYISSWLLGLILSGAYKSPTKLFNIIKGLIWGSLIILVGYSLVSEEYRFSRAIILLGSSAALIIIPFWRFLLDKIFKTNLLSSNSKSKKIAIVGELNEANRVNDLLKSSQTGIEWLGYISPVKDNNGTNEKYIGELDQIMELVTVFKIDEIIFCSKDISSEKIFSLMSNLSKLKVDIKIAPTQADFIIGSNSIDSQGSWYSISINGLNKKSQRRAKRLLDVVLSLMLFISLPLNVWWVKNKIGFIKNIMAVLRSSKTWISYDTSVDVRVLPKLKRGVLKTTTNLSQGLNDTKTIQQLNLVYAKEYHQLNDFKFILENYSKLGEIS